MLNFNRVLVLSPHTDDGELGCGGTIARWIEEGKDIHYAVFSCCEQNVPDELPQDTLAKECLNSLDKLRISSENIKYNHHNIMLIEVNSS